MRNKLIASATLAVSALSLAAAPMVASAQPQHGRHKVLVCGASRHAKNTGTVVGAITGGLLGNAVSHGGGRTGGTIIGAGVGAVAGHQIAKSNGKRHCHYEWRSY
ncbi:glycine zipper 2TM domain-containing protein [Phenylobacterium soli]|nr:glycine zipper 2TM domain-containing protein [Phenylobacterium soli]